MMRRTKKDRYFAMYKGDKYVDGGTIVELAKKYHHTIKQMIYLTYPTTLSELRITDYYYMR